MHTKVLEQKEIIRNGKKYLAQKILCVQLISSTEDESEAIMNEEVNKEGIQ